MATRNPAPVEVGSWNPIIYEVLYMPGGCFGISEPPTSTLNRLQVFRHNRRSSHGFGSCCKGICKLGSLFGFCCQLKGMIGCINGCFLFPWKTWAWWYILIYIYIYSPNWQDFYHLYTYIIYHLYSLPFWGLYATYHLLTKHQKQPLNVPRSQRGPPMGNSFTEYIVGMAMGKFSPRIPSKNTS